MVDHVMSCHVGSSRPVYCVYTCIIPLCNLSFVHLLLIFVLAFLLEDISETLLPYMAMIAACMNLL